MSAYTHLLQRLDGLSDQEARAALYLLAADHGAAVAEVLDRLKEDRR